MNIVTGTSADLTLEIMAGVARYRHRVFVEKLGSGVILLRMIPAMMESVHDELKRVFAGFEILAYREGVVPTRRGGTPRYWVR